MFDLSHLSNKTGSLRGHICHLWKSNIDRTFNQNIFSEDEICFNAMRLFKNQQFLARNTLPGVKFLIRK